MHNSFAHSPKGRQFCNNGHACYRQQVSPRIHMLKCPIGTVWGRGVFGMWSGPAGGALMSGVSTLTKRSQRAPDPSQHPRTQWEPRHPRTRKQVLTRPWLSWCLELGPPAPRTEKKINVYLVSLPVCVFCCYSISQRLKIPENELLERKVGLFKNVNI